jgi:hypothetical protein
MGTIIKIGRLILIIGLIVINSSCMSKKDKLLEKIHSLGYPDNEILVTLEDFFEGNDDYGSIGVNLYPNQPSPSDFYSKLKEIKKLDSIDNVYVRIADIENLEWVYTDAVYVVTTLSKAELTVLLSDLKPNEIHEDWLYGKPTNTPKIPNGFVVYTVWWD